MQKCIRQNRQNCVPDQVQSHFGVFLNLEMDFRLETNLKCQFFPRFPIFTVPNIHLTISGKFSEAVWQHFAVVLQMSNQSSGKSKFLSFLHQMIHCFRAPEYDLAYNKHLSSENVLVETNKQKSTV